MRQELKWLACVASAGLLISCGARTPLKPAEGSALPPAPAGAVAQPNSDELLELDALAAPERSVELRRRSEEREDDPFDLPPE
ncbi:MAG: hypothetical protein AAGL10_12155 [Pseudomonadota bacterium]